METKRIYWRTVAFGRCQYTTKTYATREAAEAARLKHAQEDQSGYSLKNTWVHGYDSARSAKDGDVSLDVGQAGRVA